MYYSWLQSERRHDLAGGKPVRTDVVCGGYGRGDAESETSNRRWNHCLRHDRIWNVPAWDFLLWKLLWMLWKWNLLREKGHGLSEKGDQIVTYGSGVGNN